MCRVASHDSPKVHSESPQSQDHWYHPKYCHKRPEETAADSTKVDVTSPRAAVHFLDGPPSLVISLGHLSQNIFDYSLLNMWLEEEERKWGVC